MRGQKGETGNSGMQKGGKGEGVTAKKLRKLDAFTEESHVTQCNHGEKSWIIHNRGRKPDTGSIASSLVLIRRKGTEDQLGKSEKECPNGTGLEVERGVVRSGRGGPFYRCVTGPTYKTHSKTK